MPTRTFASRYGAAVLCLLLSGAPVWAADPSADPAADPNLVPGASLQIDVIAKALDLARGQILPSLGSTVYGVDPVRPDKRRVELRA
jgi:hypothetical protein